MARKKARLVVRIVHIRDQDVFKREVLLLMSFVVVTSRKQCLDIVTAIDRHDSISNFVGGTVQRNGQPNLQRLLGKFANLRRQSAGRDRDVPGADAETPLRVNDPDRSQHVVEVSERLAHPHEHNVVDLFTSRALNCDELIDYFVWAQIARKTFQTARAEFAPVRTAHLGRNTNRPTVRLSTVKSERRGNQNRFDQIFVDQAKKKFPRRIVRSKHSYEVDLAKRKSLRQPFAQRFRQIGHLFDRVDALFVKPVGDLSRAI